jgi:hypothetical protein
VTLTSGRWVESLGAWLLVGLGALLLLTGTVSLFAALVERAWGEAAVTAGLMLLIALGTLRGVRQLRRGERPRRRTEDDR